MWINICDEAIQTYGKHGERFLLCLCYKKYYGHTTATAAKSEVVTAIWDSINECFYETKTGLEIDNRDIVQWWKEL